SGLQGWVALASASAWAGAASKALSPGADGANGTLAVGRLLHGAVPLPFQDCATARHLAARRLLGCPAHPLLRAAAGDDVRRMGGVGGWFVHVACLAP